MSVSDTGRMWMGGYENAEMVDGRIVCSRTREEGDGVFRAQEPSQQLRGHEQVYLSSLLFPASSASMHQVHASTSAVCDALGVCWQAAGWQGRGRVGGRSDADAPRCFARPGARICGTFRTDSA
eukprot:759026-Rhodomonas_salina.3